MRCFHCQKEISAEAKIVRQSVCEKCGSYLHCCFNCHFYDPKAYNQCREPTAERVLEKDKANFCFFFNAGDGKPQAGDRADEARKKLDALFRNKNKQ